MSIPYNDIYDKFLALIADRNLSALSDENLTAMLEIYLDGCVALYFKKCRQDLSGNKQDGEFYRKSFTGDGILTQFTISQYPTLPDDDSIETYATLDGTTVTNYTFSDTTLIFTFDAAPTGALILGYNFTGQYDLTITEEEQFIIATGMLITWVSDKLLETKKFKNLLTPKDFHGLYSPANLLEKLIAVKNDTHRDLRRLITSYTKESIDGGFDGFV